MRIAVIASRRVGRSTGCGGALADAHWAMPLSARLPTVACHAATGGRRRLPASGTESRARWPQISRR